MSNGMYDVYSCGFDGVIARPKRVHKQIIFIFAKDFACHGSHEDARESLQRSGPDRLGGGRGRVNPPPSGLVRGLGGLEGLLHGQTSTRFEAQGLGGLQKCRYDACGRVC